MGVGRNGWKGEWRDSANLKILIAFCLFVSSAGEVEACCSEGKLITQEEE